MTVKISMAGRMLSDVPGRFSPVGSNTSTGHPALSVDRGVRRERKGCQGQNGGHEQTKENIFIALYLWRFLSRIEQRRINAEFRLLRRLP
jgi:hypothetical protein